MEQYLLAILVLVAFATGFFFGQRSIKLVGQRTETLQSSDRLTVQRITPDGPEQPYVVAPPGLGIRKPVMGSMVPAPEYASLHDEWLREQGGNN